MVDAELANIIRQMLDKGMPAEQIIATLDEMGIADAKAIVTGIASQSGTTPSESSGADAAPQPASAVETAPEPPRPAVTPAKGGFQSISFGQPSGGAGSSGSNAASGGSESNLGLMPPMADLSKWEQPGKILTTDEKLEEVLALLKALQVVNRRILETDRDVLLRLKK